jgi:hypothetical protein
MVVMGFFSELPSFYPSPLAALYHISEAKLTKQLYRMNKLIIAKIKLESGMARGAILSVKPRFA